MKIHKLILMTFALAAFPSLSSAAIISQSVSLSQSAEVASSVVGSLQQFDASLGTLNKVSIDVAGTLTLSGPYTPNMIWVPSPTNIPYPVRFEVSQSLTGMLGLNGFGFALDNPAKFVFSSVATGVFGEIYAFVRNFSYNFVFDDVSELSGFALPKDVVGVTEPPLLINGDRDDFANPNLLVLSQLITVDQSGITNTPLTSMNSLLSITYDYTPFQQGNDVPEPGVLILFGVGLLAMMSSARNKRFDT